MSVIHITSVSIISFVAAFIVGALAQSSRMCFIGGWRDFFIIKDTYLLKGFFSFVLTAAVLFFAFHSMGLYLRNYPWYSRPPQVYASTDDIFGDMEIGEMVRSKDYCDLISAPDIVVGVDTNVPGVRFFNFKIPYEILMFVACAFIIGFCSTLANGCPMRQHVMAASGNFSAMLFVLSFYAAVLVYDSFLVDIIDRVLFYN